MSFEQMKVAELQGVAAAYGLEDEIKGLKKQEIIDVLNAEGVSYSDFTKMANAGREEVVEEEVDVDSLVLVKMDRPNPSYEVRMARGRVYSFTYRHPFVAMPEDDADFIFDTEDGFRLATPKEAKSFYN